MKEFLELGLENKFDSNKRKIINAFCKFDSAKDE